MGVGFARGRAGTFLEAGDGNGEEGGEGEEDEEAQRLVRQRLGLLTPAPLPPLAAQAPGEG